MQQRLRTMFCTVLESSGLPTSQCQGPRTAEKLAIPLIHPNPRQCVCMLQIHYFIHPFKGLIQPFKGLIQPFTGLIQPFKGIGALTSNPTSIMSADSAARLEDMPQEMAELLAQVVQANQEASQLRAKAECLWAATVSAEQKAARAEEYSDFMDDIWSLRPGRASRSRSRPRSS